MEKKRSNKKLFAIIGGSVLAFILTIALSVSITLAYFGDTQASTQNATIQMGQALNFKENSVTATAAVTGGGSVLPGATGTVTVNGAIQKTTTKAYLRLQFSQTGTGTSSIVLGTITTSLGSLVESGGYYYLVKSTQADGVTGTASVMQDIDASTADETNGLAISFTIPYTVSEDLTNTVAGQAIEVSATLQIIQAEYVGTTVSEVSTSWAGTVD